MKKFFNNKLSIILSIYLPIVILDQITKYIVHNNMDYHESIPIIDGFLNLTYVRNLGSAWGLFADLDSTIRTPFFWTINIVAITGISIYLFYIKRENLLSIITFTLILSGATGNFMDRLNIFHEGGYVIDFIDVYIGKYHWPAFNVADSAISIAICLMLYLSFLEEREKRKNR